MDGDYWIIDTDIKGVEGLGGTVTDTVLFGSRGERDSFESPFTQVGCCYLCMR